MVEIAQKYKDKLPTFKKNVERSMDWFKDNHDRFRQFRDFLFRSTLSDDEIAVLEELNKPQIEFNILEAYISRQRGEFSKQVPEVSVHAYDDNPQPIDIQTVDAVEGYMRHVFCEYVGSGEAYQVYTDCLSGGFSVLKVFTEYQNEKSMDQIIKLSKTDPTMCGFDLLATKPHKGDGRYCYELFPMSKEEFESTYDRKVDDLKFRRGANSNSGFNWSYENQKEKVLLICDYYVKTKKKEKLVKIAGDKTILMSEYKEMEEKWDAIDQMPQIVEQRNTEIVTITRYRFIENEILEVKKTPFKMLPLIFVDGNSVLLRKNENGAMVQMTRPYIYNAKGIQRLKNIAGQNLANELENLVQHKISVSKEAIPSEEGYADAYKNVQLASVLVHNEFKEDDPQVRLTPPIAFNRQPIPPEITNTFIATDKTTQTVLGSYDASLGINDNQLSGVAIVEGATQSNEAAMPYVVNYIIAMNRVGKIFVDIIPKYYVTPRTLPIVKEDGEHDYVKVNQQLPQVQPQPQHPIQQGQVQQMPQQPQQVLQQPKPISMRYPENALNITVKAGANFTVQKDKAVQTILKLMQASPVFAQIMQQKPEAIKVLLDNIEIRGIEQLKGIVDEFVKEVAQQKASNQQQPNPVMEKIQNDRMKLANDAQNNKQKNQIEMAKVTVAKQGADTETLKTISEVKNNNDSLLVEKDKIAAEEARATTDLALKTMDMYHKQTHKNIDQERQLNKDAMPSDQIQQE